MPKQLFYEQRIVCFIDILAFSSRIKFTERDSEEARSYLNSTCDALESLNKYKSILEKKSGIVGIQITQFSDSIVISFPWKENDAGLYIAIEAIRFIQVYMLQKYEILLRGGIVLGKLIHTDKLLVGPAMIAAYEIESKCAFSPRIVLDPRVVSRYGIIKNNFVPIGTVNSYLIQKDLDDTSFVDYFNIQKGDLLDDDERIEYFRTICKLIVANVNSSDMSIRMKYLWMRNKLKNSVVFKEPEIKAMYREIVTKNKK